MIWYTPDQAAERVSVSAHTVKRWIREERLTVTRNQIDGQDYVSEAELVALDRLMRQKQKNSRFRRIA
jgi:excisionase family DNA binding protein